MPRELIPCPSPAAYQRHRKAGEDCADCRAVVVEYNVERRGGREAYNAYQRDCRELRRRNRFGKARAATVARAARAA